MYVVLNQYPFILTRVPDHQFTAFVSREVVLIRLRCILMLKVGVVISSKRFEFHEIKLH